LLEIVLHRIYIFTHTHATARAHIERGREKEEGREGREERQRHRDMT